MISFCSYLCWGSLRLPLGLAIPQEDSQHLAYSGTHSSDLLQWRIQSRISNKNGSWGKVREKPDASFQNPLPEESHRMFWIPLETRYGNMWEVSTSEAHSGPRVFLGGWPHRHPLFLAWHQNSGLPKGKQVLSINHISVQIVHSHPLLSVREWWDPPWNLSSRMSA